MARPIVKREFIERGVLKVVSRKGLSGTTIQDIAQEAQVSPGLIYRYWRNRDDLAREVYETHYLALMAALTRDAAAQGDIWDKYRAVIESFLAFADSNPVTLKFLLLSQHDLHSLMPKDQGIRALLTRLVEEGIAQGQIRPMDHDLATQLFIGIVLQPVVGFIYGDLEGPIRVRSGEILRALERALRPQ